MGPSGGPPGPETGGAGPSRTALVAAGDEETRVLLRSLLRLHRVRVDGEAPGVRGALEILQRARPGLVLVDSDLNDGSWTDLLAGARAALPGSRFVLVTGSTPDGVRSDGPPGPDALLVRPFRIRQFAVALGPLALEPPDGSAG